MADLVTHAKQILRDAGYVVIPRERHVVLTVERAISGGLLENMRDAEEAQRFQKYCDRQISVEIGSALMDKGAITKEALGHDMFTDTYRWRYQAGVILPR